jgi:hypothetical protein
MSSESYLARWNAYLNSFNKNILADVVESPQPQVDDKSELDNAIVESTESDKKLVEP